MAQTIALIVAGSGETSEQEVTDLLLDAYPGGVEVDLIIPVSKSLFTKSVQNVVSWFNSDANVYTVKVAGEALTRVSSKLGTEDTSQEVDNFGDIFKPEEFDGWDEVHFLAAVPDPDEDSEGYDAVAEWVEAAVDAGFTVKNLCMGLDDVVLDEPTDESAPEEPQEPAEEPEGVPDEGMPADEPAEASRSLEEDLAKGAWSLPKQGLDDRDILVGFLVGVREAAEVALRSLAGSPVDLEAEFQELADVMREEAKAEEPEPEAPRRGRGRPRTKFEIKEIWDEEAETWIPRPKGRVAKGTKTRTRHDETGEILEEGVV